MLHRFSYSSKLGFLLCCCCLRVFCLFWFFAGYWGFGLFFVVVIISSLSSWIFWFCFLEQLFAISTQCHGLGSLSGSLWCRGHQRRTSYAIASWRSSLSWWKMLLKISMANFSFWIAYVVVPFYFKPIFKSDVKILVIQELKDYP